MMDKDCSVRVTRAMIRARTLEEVSGSSRLSYVKQCKRRISAAASINEKRVVLEDLTNLNTQSHKKCAKTSKVQVCNANVLEVYTKTNTEVDCNVSEQVSSTQEDFRAKLAKDLSKVTTMVHSNETIVSERMEDKEVVQPLISSDMRRQVMADRMPSNRDINLISERLNPSNSVGIVDIDSVESKDPQVWSSYGVDIYNNICVREFEKRPLMNYMEWQQDINPSMRAILIDWLVEVSEEYKLVPDTLYLTVNLIDRFLSQGLIQKQRLQLLGVSCMQIASKYEEICAPRVEEFCIITDNTYKKAEVLKMENEVLNVLHFQLSVPTTKTFLRRFILAAQSSYKDSYVELEFLANYLAELTLVDYSFLRFLPSLIAASAVLLAGWTLNQLEHPWNATMEHYTNYKVSELKTTVVALADLQLNTKGCGLNAIREKYKQQKFKGVANLYPKPVQTLF